MITFHQRVSASGETATTLGEMIKLAMRTAIPRGRIVRCSNWMDPNHSESLGKEIFYQMGVALKQLPLKESRQLLLGYYIRNTATHSHFTRST